MPEPFVYDVFLSHSSKDKDIVRPIAERLRADGVRVWFDDWEMKPGDSIPAMIEEGLENSRVLVLCMSINAFGSDWAQLESGTFRFRDPLNKERRFIPLRLDDTPIKGSLTQFLYVDWSYEKHEGEYKKLCELCRKHAFQKTHTIETEHKQNAENVIQLNFHEEVWTYAFSPDAKYVLTGGQDSAVRLWSMESGECLYVVKNDTDDDIWSIAWSNDQSHALFGTMTGKIQRWDFKNKKRLKALRGHHGDVWCVTISNDQRGAISGSDDTTIRVWDLDTKSCQAVFKGHLDRVLTVILSSNHRYAFSGSEDTTIRLWDIEAGRCLRVFEGHTDGIRALALSPNQKYVASASDDLDVRVWSVESGYCNNVFEGHYGRVSCVTWLSDRYVISGADDATARVWDVVSGRCLCVLEDHVEGIKAVTWCSQIRRILTGDYSGEIRVWDLSGYLNEVLDIPPAIQDASNTLDQVQYTNAKVLLVGNTSSGKTGLAHRLATGRWRPSDGSTIGAWSTQWPLLGVDTTKELDREIWLWDFGGQADQRLIHQLYMDHTAMILLLFDADKEDVLPGLREWQTALRRCVPDSTPLLLVAGRIDAGFRASREKLKKFVDEQSFSYFETSAYDGTGCDELAKAITGGIPWEQMEQRTSPRIFKLIKDHILKLRDEGQVLHTFKELRDLLWQRLGDEPRFSDDVLKTAIGLLDGPGAVKELEYGTYILLQPEWINAYAQAVIRTLRQEPSELGCLPLQSIAEGKLLFQTVERDGSILEMKRLPEVEERIVLREMERQMEERGLCLRQGDKLVFPSHCGRECPEVVAHPSVVISYLIKGYLDDIYATLVVKLAESCSFSLKELWRDAADFDTLAGACRMGIKLKRNSAGTGEIMVYFGPGVSQGEQVIFANYIHAHLDSCCEQVQRLRHYVCPHCNTPKGNSNILMEKLLNKKQHADTECDKCGERFALWDALEKRFASADVRKQVEGLKAGDITRLDTRRKGKLLALEVMARISSADQKCFEIPATEDEGIDIELEFTDDGKGTGKRLYLQLKSGNSYLRTLNDDTKIFDIKEQRWVEYWLKQPHPVMLVIGTFTAEDDGNIIREKLEFADVRWMEISNELKRLSNNGEQPVKHIEFRGERLDMDSIHRWRSKVLGQ